MHLFNQEFFIRQQNKMFCCHMKNSKRYRWQPRTLIIIIIITTTTNNENKHDVAVLL
jgi:menaquinone-dependent protoporphyrinogen IX oxidase